MRRTRLAEAHQRPGAVMADARELAECILAAAKVFEDATGARPTSVMMSAEDAEALGLQGEPVQQVPIDVDGLRWWMTMPPSWA